MSDTFILILVPVVLIAGLIGAAYFLDKRGRKSRPAEPVFPAPAPIGKTLLWIVRILVVLMVLSIMGAFVFRSMALVWFTGGCIGLYIVIGLIHRFVRLADK
jgi:hypothetical protein